MGFFTVSFMAKSKPTMKPSNQILTALIGNDAGSSTKYIVTNIEHRPGVWDNNRGSGRITTGYRS